MTSDNLSNSKESKAKLDYLKELLMDRTMLSNYPNIFLQVAKILEKEILRTRSALLSMYGIYTISESDLPEPSGQKVNLQYKVYMPADSNSSFNFVGRILGPDGSTAKCLQQCLGVKIMVRGRGSMRDRKKEEANIGRPNWEHLNDKLHVVLTVEDYENRAKARLSKASDYITLFLKESMKGSDREDKVKQMQLMELSFQRDQRLTWTLDCNNLLELGKAGPPMYYSLANLLNFTYPAYPPASLFPAIQAPAAPPSQHQQQHQQQQQGPPHGGRYAHQSHARHYYSPPSGQAAGQSAVQQTHSQVGHFTPVSRSGSHLAGSGANSQHHHQLAAVMSAGGLAFSPSSAGHVGSTALLLGATGAQGGGHHHHQQHHPGAYSPPVGGGASGSSGGTSALPPGAVAMTPISYWPPGPVPPGAPGFSQLAAMDYHQHAHQLHHPAAGHEQINQLQQAASGYAPYVTGAHLHSLGYPGEFMPSAPGQEYSPCSADGQLGPLPTSKSAGGADSVNVLLPPLHSADDVQSAPVAAAVEENVNANLGSLVVTSEEGPVSTPVTDDTRAGVMRESDSGAESEEPNQSGLCPPLGELANGAGHAAGNAAVITTASPHNKNNGKQSFSKHTGVGKTRYSQKHHSQFNTTRNNSQQQLPMSTLMPTPQQPGQTGKLSHRSDIVTVRVGSCEVSGFAPSPHSTAGTGMAGNKGEPATIGKQKVSPSRTADAPRGPSLLGVKREARGTSGRTVAATAVGSKKPMQPTVLPTSETDWPKLGSDVKGGKSGLATDGRIDRDLLNLSISGSTTKAI